MKNIIIIIILEGYEKGKIASLSIVFHAFLFIFFFHFFFSFYFLLHSCTPVPTTCLGSIHEIKKCTTILYNWGTGHPTLCVDEECSVAKYGRQGRYTKFAMHEIFFSSDDRKDRREVDGESRKKIWQCIGQHSGADVWLMDFGQSRAGVAHPHIHFSLLGEAYKFFL